MKSNSIVIKEIIMAGLLLSLGIVFPAVFHSFGLGPVFLPMHIPVMLAGFVLTMPYAITVGALTPFLSTLITGMPPIFPVMPYMVFELAAYAGSISILNNKFKFNSYVSLIVSMLIGRIVAGIVVWILATFFGAELSSPIIFIISAIANGMPGIIIQIIFIPPVIFLLKKANIIRSEVCSIEQ